MQAIAVRSPGAIALGILFAGGTAFVLLHDVRSLADIRINHVMTALVLIGTIASGHMLAGQVKQRRILSALGLAVLFAAGTFYCVVSSAARNAEGTLAASDAITAGNALRAEAERTLVDARRRYAEALDDERDECASGDGLQCKAHRKTTAERRADLGLALAGLGRAPPAQVEHAGIKHAAKVFAALPGVTTGEDGIARRLLMVFPFAKALFLELASIVFFGVGLGPAASPHGGPRPDTPRAEPDAGPVPEPVPPEPARNRTQIHDWVHAFRQRHGRDPRIPELQEQFRDVPKTSAWRYARAG